MRWIGKLVRSGHSRFDAFWCTCQVRITCHNVPVLPRRCLHATRAHLLPVDQAQGRTTLAQRREGRALGTRWQDARACLILLTGRAQVACVRACVCMCVCVCMCMRLCVHACVSVCACVFSKHECIVDAPTDTGAYESSSTFGKNNRAATIKGRHDGPSVSDVGPGPGAYSAGAGVGGGGSFKYTMGGRYSDRDYESTPGPGRVWVWLSW